MPLLFSYGTLQRREVQIATFGRPLAGMPDALPRFRPARIPIGNPVIEASIGDTHYDNAQYDGDAASAVSGTAFEVTEEELADADVYEQPANYVRIAVTLASGKPAWVYVAADSARRVPDAPA